MEILENIYIDWCGPYVGVLLGFEYEPLIIVKNEDTGEILNFKIFSLGFLLFRIDLLIEIEEE